MTTEALVENSKIEVICRECGDTLLAPELAEFFNEEQLILNFWSCSNCGFRFETEEKIRSEATSQIDESGDEAKLFPETFFHHRVFERRLSKRLLRGCNRHVRFTPKSGHVQCTRPCLLWANSGH